MEHVALLKYFSLEVVHGLLAILACNIMAMIYIELAGNLKYTKKFKQWFNINQDQLDCMTKGSMTQNQQ